MKDVETYNYSGMEYFKGKIKNKDVILAVCGVGKVNASICTQNLIDKFKVNAVINIGIAGSMDKKLSIYQ